jgi:hypothetical protein
VTVSAVGVKGTIAYTANCDLHTTTVAAKDIFEGSQRHITAPPPLAKVYLALSSSFGSLDPSEEYESPVA